MHVYIPVKQEVCSRLWCQPNGGSCTTRNVPAADGTNCGSSNVSYQILV